MRYSQRESSYTQTLTKQKMKQTNFAVELPNGYVLGYFNTYKDAINYVSKSDYLGIYDLQIRNINN